MTYNILYYNSVDGAITQFSSADLNQLAEYILEIMASGTYAGTISVGTSNPIGTFTDTVRQGGVGSSDVTILSNTYTLSQTNTVQSAASDPPQYMGLTVAGDVTTLQQNLTTLDDLADEIIQVMVGTYGVNSYYLGTSAPADGGTWVSRGSLTDTLENFTVVNQDWQLWHKVSAATYTGFKNPLKLAGNELQQWTQAEVEALVKKVEQRIVSTSIGSYALQSSVPASGTWVNVGTITDVIRNTVDGNYVVSENVSFQSPEYIGTAGYLATYVGPAVTFVGSYQSTYVGTNVGFAGVGGSYFGPIISYVSTGGTYAGSTFFGPAFYLGANFDGPIFSGSYVGTSFTGPSYIGPATFAGFYLGTIDTTYTGSIVDSTTNTSSTVTLWKRVA